MAADIIDLDFERRLREGLTVNSCIERAHRYRQQAGDLSRAGWHHEASISLEEAEKAEQHARRLAMAAKAKDERNGT